LVLGIAERAVPLRDVDDLAVQRIFFVFGVLLLGLVLLLLRAAAAGTGEG
jgi:hypothetical protein